MEIPKTNYILPKEFLTILQDINFGLLINGTEEELYDWISQAITEIKPIANWVNGGGYGYADARAADHLHIFYSFVSEVVNAWAYHLLYPLEDIDDEEEAEEFTRIVKDILLRLKDMQGKFEQSTFDGNCFQYKHEWNPYAQGLIDKPHQNPWYVADEDLTPEDREALRQLKEQEKRKRT